MGKKSNSIDRNRKKIIAVRERERKVFYVTSLRNEDSLTDVVLRTYYSTFGE